MIQVIGRESTYGLSKVDHSLDYVWDSCLLVQILNAKQMLVGHSVRPRSFDERLNVGPLIIFCPWLLDFAD